MALTLSQARLNIGDRQPLKREAFDFGALLKPLGQLRR
jgi:hypothetical protein